MLPRACGFNLINGRGLFNPGNEPKNPHGASFAVMCGGERIERLRRGEQVSRGEELDLERCPRDTRRGARYAGSYSLATRGYADANGINVRRSVRRGEGPE